MSAPAALPAAPATASSFNFAPALAPPSDDFSSPAPARASALPDPPTPPQSSSRSEDGYRWDLALGYEYVHFHSAPFNLNLSGLHTDLTYNLNNWVGVEGSVISAFGGTLFDGERSKYVSYTGGARINGGASHRGFTPWAHALVGGVHVNPQTALGSKNSYAVQAGGGVDWIFNSRVSLRGEADYVHTALYHGSQNNFQIGLGAVIHF
ncbi:MAG TPA: outer membrane beta-barrel protein [Candidatus Acidoferrum sp.]